MTYLKNLGLAILGVIVPFIVLTFLTTLLHYNDIIGSNTANIMKIISLILSLSIGSFILGKKAEKKGWLEGIKFGGIFLILILLSNLLFLKTKLEIKFIVYSAIIFASTIFGSMVGIGTQKEQK